ncbi:hypothetical protein [Pseudomonas sp. BMS12]|uniref:hypothetical protein n=1 Tax=Pseudomonas sp. BMS12 TaxID=1796033 RepID=UPI000ACED687|nr:hypothetical protein [Pseudomonas sp. BMS12]
MIRLDFLSSQKEFGVAVGSVLFAIFGAILLLALDVALPFTSAYADVGPAYLIYASFFCVLLLSYFLSLFFVSGSSNRNGRNGLPSGLLQVVHISLLVSVLAIFSLFIDRVFYRGIDFSVNNFVEIRDALNATSDGSVSSVFSFFGNLFQFSYFFALVSVFFYRDFLGWKRFLFYLFVICMCVFVGSYLLGGRAIIAVFILTLLTVLVARVIAGFSSFKIFLKARFLLLCGALVVLFLFVFIYVFYMRSSVGGDGSLEYLNKFLLHLHGVSLLPSQLCGGEFLCDVKNYFYLTVLYCTHIFWVLAENVSYSPLEAGGDPVFGAVLNILSRLFQLEVGEYRFSGLFNSMPGSLYYSWGLWGVWIGAGVIGCFLALAVFFLRFYKSFFSVLFFYFFYMVLLVSPVLSVLNVVSFVFLMFCLCFYFLVLRIFYST